MPRVIEEYDEEPRRVRVVRSSTRTRYVPRPGASTSTVAAVLLAIVVLLLLLVVLGNL